MFLLSLCDVEINCYILFAMLNACHCRRDIAVLYPCLPCLSQYALVSFFLSNCCFRHVCLSCFVIAVMLPFTICDIIKRLMHTPSMAKYNHHFLKLILSAHPLCMYTLYFVPNFYAPCHEDLYTKQNGHPVMARSIRACLATRNGFPATAVLPPNGQELHHQATWHLQRVSATWQAKPL